MGKLKGIIGRNRLYVLLVAFILFVNLLVFVVWIADKSGKTGPLDESGTAGVSSEQAEVREKTLLEEDDIQVRQEKIEALAEEDPLLYIFLGVFNLMILFVIVLGVGLDVYLLIRWVRKDPLHIRMVEGTHPLWTIGDVIRVIIIFLASGYAFVILQSFFSRVIPAFNNENFRMIFNTAVMNVVGISVILYFIVKKYHQDIKEAGLTLKKFSTGVFYAITGYMALLPILVIILVITFFVTRFLEYKPPVQPIVEVFIKEKGTSMLWFSAVFAAVFGPIAEEIFFRGFMYNAVKKKTGIFWAVIITSAIFSLLHAHIVGFFPIFALGVLLAYLYEKTGSLVPSMAVHITHNLGMVILVFLMKGIG